MKEKHLDLIFFLPVVLFAEYILAAIVGCTAYVCGAGEKFYCTIYCYSLMTVFSLTIAAFVFRYFKKR